MEQRYKEALSEIEQALACLPSEDIDKIPQNFKDFITKNKCKWHKITEDDELSEETLAILAIIYRKFLASPEEQAELERKFQEKLKKEKEELKSLVESSKVEANSEINYNFVQPTTVKNVELVEYKDEKWYIKLIEKLKKYFNID